MDDLIQLEPCDGTSGQWYALAHIEGVDATALVSGMKAGFGMRRHSRRLCFVIERERIEAFAAYARKRGVNVALDC